MELTAREVTQRTVTEPAAATN